MADRGNVDGTGIQQGNVSRSAFEALTLAPDHGASVCGDPINPFGINSISPECAATFTLGATNDENVRQIVGEAFVTGPVFEIPAGEVQSAVGIMYKQDQYTFLPDPSLRAESLDPLFGNTRTDIVGFNAAEAVRGDTTSREVYVEAQFPLLADMPAIQAFDLTLAYRFAAATSVPCAPRTSRNCSARQSSISRQPGADPPRSRSPAATAEPPAET